MSQDIKPDFLLWVLDNASQKHGIKDSRLYNLVYLMQNALKREFDLDLGYKFENLHYEGPFSKQVDQDMRTGEKTRCVGGKYTLDSDNYLIKTTDMGRQYVERHGKKALESVLGEDTLQKLSEVLREYSHKSDGELLKEAISAWNEQNPQAVTA